MSELGAEALAVYLKVPEEASLAAAVVAVTPMGVGTVESVPLDRDVYPSSRAYHSGVIASETSVRLYGEQPDLSVLVPFPYAITAVPLTAGGTRFGTLSACWLGADASADEQATSTLVEIARVLAGHLARFAEDGVSLAPPAMPLVVGAADGKHRSTGPAPGIFHLHKLAVGLASARSTDEVVDLALRRLVDGFGARSVLLTLSGGDRLRVIGASGCSDAYLRSVSTASLSDGTPEARAFDTVSRLVYDPSAPETRGRSGDGEADGDLTWVVFPLPITEGALGTCSVAFDREHLALLRQPTVFTAFSGMLGQALDRIRLHEAQHALAENLQAALLPRLLPQLAGVVSTSRYVPATTGIEVGGDWYDLIRQPGGAVMMVIGDVQGHNTAAAVVMGQLRSAVRAYAAEGHGPAAVLLRTNRLMVQLGTELFATCCCVSLDPDTGETRVATAGHPLPLIRYEDGRYPDVDAGPGIPLGIDAEASFAEGQIALPPGTFLAFYTDGLAGSAGLLAPDRLEAALAQAQGELESVADHLVADAGPPARRRADDAALQLVFYEGPSMAAQRNVRQLMLARRDLRGPQYARKSLQHWLTDWNLSLLTDTADLLVSEVVTNGIVHGDSDVHLCVRRYPGTLRVEVRDTDPRPPRTVALPGTEDEAEGGRGLLIVSTLAASWGNSPSGRGKTVWFELSTTDPALETS